MPNNVIIIIGSLTDIHQMGKQLNYIPMRGNRTPGSRVETPVATRRSATKYCNSFQLTHIPRSNHAQSIASNGDQKEDKTLLQHSQLSQHGDFPCICVLLSVYTQRGGWAYFRYNYYTSLHAFIKTECTIDSKSW